MNLQLVLNYISSLEADRDRLLEALDRIARGAESNPPAAVAEMAWKALREETL